MHVLVNQNGFYVHKSIVGLVQYQHGASLEENEATRIHYLPRRERVWTENLLDAACIQDDDYYEETWTALFPGCRKQRVVLSVE